MTRRILLSLIAALVAVGCQAPQVPVAPDASPSAQAPAAEAIRMKTYDLELQFAGEAALAGYHIAVVDAVSGQALPLADAPLARGAAIIAAGGGNIVSTGGGNIISAGGGNLTREVLSAEGLVTDDQGRLRLMLAGVEKGTILRFVATGEGRRLEALHVAEPSVQPQGYLLQQASTLRLVLSPVTSAGTRLLNGLVRLSRALKPQLREALMLEAIESFNHVSGPIGEKLAEKPHLALQLTLDPAQDTHSLAALAALRTVLAQAGVEKTVVTFLTNAVRTLETQLQDPANRSGEALTEERVVLEGTDLVVEIAQENVNLTDVVTGEPANAPVPGGSTGGVVTETPVPTTANVTIR